MSAMSGDSTNQERSNRIAPPVSRRQFMALTAAGIGTVAGIGHTAAQLPDDAETIEDEMVEMRDGRRLATDIYLPAENNRPAPTIVARTPYNKDGESAGAAFFVEHGYAYVAQDVRGKFASNGDFYPYRSEGNAEANDGYDTVEWAADQEWSNGRVGTVGASYGAGTQWAMVHADEGLPPSLKTMVPAYPVSSYYLQGAYNGGAALLSHNIDYLNGFLLERIRRDDIVPGNEDFSPEDIEELSVWDRAQETMMQQYWSLPVQPYAPHERDEVDHIDWLFDWHDHETFDDYWEQQDTTQHYDDVDIPVLNIGGWYDIFTQGVVQNYTGMLEEGGSRKARQESGLIIGPYTHGNNDMRAQGQVTGSAYQFPENVTFDRSAAALAWMDTHLKDDASGWNQSGGGYAVRAYIPGLDEWIGADQFPLPETQWVNYYFHSDGNANVSTGVDEHNPRYEGRLSTDSPGDQSPDEYTYDPADPVISVGGYNTHWTGGVADRATAYHDRDDILVYQTDLLDEDVAVVGPITVRLHAATSAVDTDFVVNLSDANPTARTGGLLVAEGARRGRIGDVEADPRDVNTYRNIELLEPGNVNTWQIAVWPTARVFAAGHRIRVDVTSSDFPRYNRNLNTGEGLTGEEMVTADQTIYHDHDRPSHICLPIVPMEALEKRIIDGPTPDIESSDDEEEDT